MEVWRDSASAGGLNIAGHILGERDDFQSLAHLGRINAKLQTQHRRSSGAVAGMRPLRPGKTEIRKVESRKRSARLTPSEKRCQPHSPPAPAVQDASGSSLVVGAPAAILDCGGKSDATPLFGRTPRIFLTSHALQKAVSAPFPARPRSSRRFRKFAGHGSTRRHFGLRGQVGRDPAFPRC